MIYQAPVIAYIVICGTEDMDGEELDVITTIPLEFSRDPGAKQLYIKDVGSYQIIPAQPGVYAVYYVMDEKTDLLALLGYTFPGDNCIDWEETAKNILGEDPEILFDNLTDEDILRINGRNVKIQKGVQLGKGISWYPIKFEATLKTNNSGLEFWDINTNELMFVTLEYAGENVFFTECNDYVRIVDYMLSAEERQKVDVVVPMRTKR